ncbi:putative O-methylsterigmatocystin oxidoreductase [Clohesyomyces aquaticus]|uniref:Putative O-methylsterigmatocystin oxidoreductase n=1 Tax=Clohesyomyces aquaticus TaxID=1231657 RepID=A0A1Y1YA77_9PLEO|nr:putative O-methylsterigmatocystin oxidoreductase [Clohesyomyces aquaticus]
MALLTLYPRLSTLALFTVLCLIWKLTTYLSFRQKSKGLPLPPSPASEPILGHLRIIPSSNPEYYYQALSKSLNSDILSFNVLGQPIIVLNSVRSATDLLDKRGANYSDRPRFVLFEVMGWGMTLTFLRTGPKFKMHRKVLQKTFQKSSVVQYRPLQEKETRVLLEGIMRSPGDWEMLLRRFATAIVMGIGFGVVIESDKDPFIQMAVDASYALGHGGAPAGTLVDFFPFVKNLPDWLVRDRSLKFARDWRWAIRQIHEAPYGAGEKQSTETSLVQTLLGDRQKKIDAGEPEEMTIEDIKGAAGAVYAAGQDTTWSTLVVFVLNMVLYPEVQDKAQKTIDSVIEPGRLPTFADRPNLPYIDYIVQETLRWCPVSPVGVPHRSIQDDVYNGFFIPAGSFIYANARAMTHDEDTYLNPDTFDPDRYIPQSAGGRGEPFPKGQFGFGRRICVGQHLAEASVWIVVASLLSVVRVERWRDEVTGLEEIPTVEVTNGLTSHPKAFRCRMVPREDRLAALR